jgi:hypothetical protein
MATKPKSAPQEQADVETEQGFRGLKVDPTPNENYTAAGVTSGKPTPETDSRAAQAARDAAETPGL